VAPLPSTAGGTTYDIIKFLICIIQKREYLQNKKTHRLKSLFKKAAIIFTS